MCVCVCVCVCTCVYVCVRRDHDWRDARLHTSQEVCLHISMSGGLLSSVWYWLVALGSLQVSNSERGGGAEEDWDGGGQGWRTRGHGEIGWEENEGEQRAEMDGRKMREERGEWLEEGSKESGSVGAHMAACSSPPRLPLCSIDFTGYSWLKMAYCSHRRALCLRVVYSTLILISANRHAGSCQ